MHGSPTTFHLPTPLYHILHITRNISELLDKQVNVQKESLKNFWGLCKLTKKVHDVEKKTAMSKIFLWKEGLYKAVSTDFNELWSIDSFKLCSHLTKVLSPRVHNIRI